MSEQYTELKEKLATLKNGLKVTQIVVSRVIKNREGGDVFVSLTANHEEGLSVTDARLSSYLLGLEVQTQALEQAVGAGVYPSYKLDSAKEALRANFSKLIIDSQGDK